MAQTDRTFDVTREENIPVPMRDGTILRADVYRPEAPGAYPVLLCRTPYNKSPHGLSEGLAAHGYIAVVQDVRGRYASDGEFRPGFYRGDTYDAADGYDSVEWAARLPGSTGKVGTFGNSYNGWTQWELAPTRPPSLKTMYASGIAANLLDRELSAVLRLGRVLWWSVNTLAPDLRLRAGKTDGPITTEEAQRIWEEQDRSKWLWFLPLLDIPDHVLSDVAPHFRYWLEDHTLDHFGFLQKHQDVNVPVLSVTGWYDQQIGTIKHFTGMTANGMTQHARANQKLIVGPWTHTAVDLHRTVGSVDFGPAAVRDYYAIADAWFRAWLKDDPSGIENWPPIQLFVMGANHWRGENEWPLARTQYTDFYLHSGGNANTPAGDGVLLRAAPSEEPPDHYTYDPRDPVMTLYSGPGQQEPHDQSALAHRQDILTFATPPLETPLEVTGPITVTLWAASSARDTDFVVKLIDVWPDGFAQELCHGIVRARYRETYTEPTLIEPNGVYRYTIHVNPTSNLFRAGHRLRIDISSSDFPNFDRNHNTGLDDYADGTLVTARQTIFHDHSRPSHVTLPVIPQ